jgi:chromosome segregation protein
MKLTKLELSGFKSFADTVLLTFEQGVTAIVGPNGCGKSNVSDAVRWVLGEQSARLLRGGKMEDVIFQGSTGRRPVNLTEVSLYLDNSDGDLPIAYQEVVITRRLSRSGQSDYMLNGSVVRLRDIQDLLRGTGLGSDAGVVIESKMIDLLLSDRADERRSLFEEAAGIGLYRDRKQSTERRLEETAGDLQRVEDLIAEVQSQIRSLARQKGKAERHTRLMEEKFSLQVTLAQRHLERLHEEVAGLEARHAELEESLPRARTALHAQEQARVGAAEGRAAREAGRSEIVQRLAAVRLELGRLDGELNVARERLQHFEERRRRAGEERTAQAQRAEEARQEEAAALEQFRDAEADAERIRTEVSARAGDEEASRMRLQDSRAAVRTSEQGIQAHLQQFRALEGERGALEGELASLRERQGQADALLESRRSERVIAERKRDHLVEQSGIQAYEARRAAEAAERARHLVAERREHEAGERAARRQAEEALAQLSARRQALEELERDRVGLAPAAAALLARRDRFGDAVLGPLSDFVSTGHHHAELTERLLGEWMHAVLVRDAATVDAVRQWHAESQPGALVLLPVAPGPNLGSAGELDSRLRVEGPARDWVRAALAGSEVLDEQGQVLRRASGAIFLSGGTAPSGPLRRRAELEQLAAGVIDAEARLRAAEASLEASGSRLAEAEQALAEASAQADAGREAERRAVAEREDVLRLVTNLLREVTDAEQQRERLAGRIDAAERRLAEIDAALLDAERAGAQLEEQMGSARARLTELEAQQEAAREARVQWQVQEAHVTARLRAAEERATRARRACDDAVTAMTRLDEETAALAADAEALARQRNEWEEQRAAQLTSLRELEDAATIAERGLAEATAALLAAEAAVEQARADVEASNEEHHSLQIRLTEAAARRRSIIERVETEWRRPLSTLLETVEPLDLDFETLESETARVVEALEAIGPVNPLAVEEHAEESKRLEFLVTQRDDLVSARQSLLLAIREIDGTARQLFVETFAAVQQHFRTVFTTLFGGGECELRLSDPEAPLESEIEIHAAPRGKRTQRIHLLSSGERTLVAASLLFSIYLTKPSPFCLMDEVDAPLDDSNVGRFTRLLEEFKHQTQFLVITHNPRTMQAADAVYGVTMQEPGVSTIVGVRLAERERVA